MPHPGERACVRCARPIRAGTPRCPACAAEPRPQGRRRQTLRQVALRRAGNVCEAPGCTMAYPLQVHHVQPLSEGGSNDLSNLIVLCPDHHVEAHRKLKAA